MLEYVVIASSKSEVDTCINDRDINQPKSADRQTDRQTAFQLYIVDDILVINICYFSLKKEME